MSCEICGNKCETYYNLKEDTISTCLCVGCVNRNFKEDDEGEYYNPKNYFINNGVIFENNEERIEYNRKYTDYIRICAFAKTKKDIKECLDNCGVRVKNFQKIKKQDLINMFRDKLKERTEQELKDMFKDKLKIKETDA